MYVGREISKLRLQLHESEYVCASDNKAEVRHQTVLTFFKEKYNTATQHFRAEAMSVRAPADVVDGLVVDHEGAVGVLQGGVCRQN